MARLNGRQWGLVLIIAGSPLGLALLLAAVSPPLLHAAAGTVLGGLSWAVATLLGLAGGALYASGLGRLAQVPSLSASEARRSAATVLAALPSLGLCVVPAVFLLLAGPAFGSVMERKVESFTAPSSSIRSEAQDFAGRVLRQLPRALPFRLPGSVR